MNRNLYLLRIILVALIAYLLGAVTVYLGNIFILCIVFGLAVGVFFLYEAMVIERINRKESQYDAKRKTSNY